MLRRQPVVDGHHDGVRADGVLAAGAVVGVEVARDEAAAVEIQDDGRSGALCAVIGIGWRPIDPDPDVARWTVDVTVFNPQFWVHRPARQVAESLPERVDSVFGG